MRKTAMSFLVLKSFLTSPLSEEKELKFVKLAKKSVLFNKWRFSNKLFDLGKKWFQKLVSDKKTLPLWRIYDLKYI